MRLGAAILCIGATSCLLVDVLWLTATGGWTLSAAAFAMGVGAPFVAAITAVGAITVGAWRASAEVTTGARELRDRAVAEARRAPDRAVAAGCAGALLTIAAAAIALAGARSVVAAVRTPRFAALLVLFVAAVVVAGAALSFPLVYVPLRTAARHLARARWGRALVRPAVVAGTLGLGALAATGWGIARHADVLALLPWNLAAASALGGLVALGLAVRARRAPKLALRLPRVALGLGAVELALTLYAARIPEEQRLVRAVVGARPSFVRAALFRLDRALDVDGDGATSWFGGDDCAPWDPERRPDRLEIPNNGVDEDCTGRDLTLDTDAFRPGRLHHGRPSSLSRPPHLFLVTTDGLSAGHTGLGGYRREVTPALDAWARRATVFEHAFAAGPSTVNSFPATFSGLPAPLVPGLWPPSVQPPTATAKRPTLAKRLRDAGYRTVAVVGSDAFSPKSWPAIAEGFDELYTEPMDRAARREPGAPKLHTAPDVTAVAIEALAAARDEPTFLWVHYFDHHPPHALPAGEVAMGAGADRVDVYDAELRYADRSWGALMEHIEAAYAPEEYVLVFTADHGEAIGVDHDGPGHDHCLRHPEVAVPFVVQTAAGRGERRQGLVSLLDVMPTFLDLASAEAPQELRGESLVPALYEGREPEKNVVLTVRYSPADAMLLGGSPLRQIGIRTDDLFYLDDRGSGVRSLVDWRADPDERQDLSAARPDDVERARYFVAQELEQWARHGVPVAAR